MMRRLCLPALAIVALATPAFAHSGDGGSSSAFIGGFAHPLLGIDHILAMIAVGLWATLLGGRAVWVVPTAFVATMLGGFALAVAGITLPAVESGIAASVLILGTLIAAAARLPLGLAASLVGLFALFHGHAHGTELTGAATAFGLGFAAATALLHGAGIALGLLLAARPQWLVLARSLGGITAGVGLLLLGGWS